MSLQSILAKIRASGDAQIYEIEKNTRSRVGTDGGRTFEPIGERTHPDHQSLWIDPRDPDRMLNGNDGGLFVSYNRGETFEFLGNVVLSQLYHVNYDMQTPYNVCGGLQDNGNWCGPSAAPSRDGIRLHEWSFLSFGDGFWAVPVTDKPWLVYSNTQGGPLYATDLRTGNTRAVHPYPKDIGSTGGPLPAFSGSLACVQTRACPCSIPMYSAFHCRWRYSRTPRIRSGKWMRHKIIKYTKVFLYEDR